MMRSMMRNAAIVIVVYGDDVLFDDALGFFDR